MKFSVKLTGSEFVACVGLLFVAFAVFDFAHHRAAAAPAVVDSQDRIVTRDLCLVDHLGHTRARLTLGDNDAPTLELFDANQTRREALRLNGDGVPSLRLYDDQGRVRSVTGFNLTTMDPTVALFDGAGVGHPLEVSGDAVWQAPLLGDADQTWGAAAPGLLSAIGYERTTLQGDDEARLEQAKTDALAALERSHDEHVIDGMGRSR